MKGYRELQKEVEEARKNMKEMEEMKYKKEKTVQTSFYKSPVGTRSQDFIELSYHIIVHFTSNKVGNPLVANRFDPPAHNLE